ncbi:MAG: antibiotic biosynthesis monooxygenase [Sphingomonadales bacterium]|nr:antibiotic biosynthesis monooxygenase [Sphingomonadales bacterium]
MADTKWGLLGRMTAQPGKRDELIAVLRESSRDVPGKLVYLIQLEPDDPDSFWINEVWQSQAHYDACLTLPQVQRGMERARPLLAGIAHRTETTPLD